MSRDAPPISRATRDAVTNWASRFILKVFSQTPTT